jgi:glycosyltransferase involved in cell wall biosynthesis
MNICIIIAGKFKKLAGLEKHFIELSIGLSKFINVSVVAHKSYESSFHNTNVDFLEFNLNTNRYNIITYYKLYNILKTKKFDIVHTQANKATYIVSKIKKYIDKTKFVATLHNKKNKIGYFSKMDLTVGVSDFVCDQLNSKTETIYNGIDTSSFLNSRSFDIRNKLEIKNNYPILVSVGRLVKAKGFDLLIEAVKDLDVNVIILGDGKEELYLKDLISKYDLKEKVFLLGFVDNVKEYIKSSDGVVISSRNEGFSYVFAETLCSKTPLISTDVADIKKFIPEELLIDQICSEKIEEKISYFLNNKDSLDLDEYYNNALNKLSFENMINETIIEYKKLLKT